jgi:outer membrane protein TolC
LATLLVLAPCRAWAQGATATEEDAAPPTSEGAATSLEDLVADSIDGYPDLLSQWREVEALRHREDQVSQPFDPMVSVAAMNLPWNSFSLQEHAMTGIQVGVSQRFYWPNALDARAEEVRAMVAAREATVPEAVIRIWLHAVEPYYSLIELDRVHEVLEAQREVFSALREAAQARYEARVSQLTDVLRVDTALNGLDQDIARVERSRRIAQARLNGLLNRPSDAAIAPHRGADAVSPEGDADAWLARTIENRPAFEALEARRLLVDAQVAAAEASDDPIFNVGLGWTARFQDAPVGTDLITLSVGVNLPFFSSRRADARVQELLVEDQRIDQDEQALLRQLRADIGTQLEAMAGLEVEIERFDTDLIPSVEALYDGALAHYSSSHTSIETLIEIEARMVHLHVTRAQLVSQHDMRRATLRAISADSERLRELAWRTQ